MILGILVVKVTENEEAAISVGFYFALLEASNSQSSSFGIRESKFLRCTFGN